MKRENKKVKTIAFTLQNYLLRLGSNPIEYFLHLHYALSK
jgi:hypothetical protein